MKVTNFLVLLKTAKETGKKTFKVGGKEYPVED